jgi:hypothetical protein
MEPHVTFDYTTVLNVVFLGLATVLVVRFDRSPLRRHRRGDRFGGASIDARLRVFPG